MRFGSSLIMAALACAVNAGDAFKSMTELCLENGFRSESYTVVTEDGYVLGLYRIPGAFTDKTEDKPAVLMLHC